MPNKQLAIYRAAAFAASKLPGDLSCRAAEATGALVGRLPDYDGKRSVVASHMSKVLGRALVPAERRHLVAAVYANYARYWAESLRLPSLSGEAVLAGVVTSGEEHLDAALARGRGVVVAAPHLGGWEWGARYLLARGIQVTVAVEPLRPPEVFEWFVSFRERLGMQVVAVGPAAGAAVLRALKANHVVCLLSDRLVGGVSGVEVEFFGQEVLMPAGPVTMALRAHSPLLTAAIYCGRQADAHQLTFRPPLELGGEGRFRELVRQGAQRLAADLEVLIAQAPEQWHILQPNWPGDPQLYRPRDWAWRLLRGVPGRELRAQ